MDFFGVDLLPRASLLAAAAMLWIFKAWWKMLPPAGLKRVPTVKGMLPFVGHGLNLGNLISFLRECSKLYGPIFHIKLFRTNLVVVFSRSIFTEYFAQKESNMSLYHYLKRLYFGRAFTDDERHFDGVIDLVRNNVAANMKTFSPKIKLEAGAMMARLENMDSEEVDLSKMFTRFVAATSARCFIVSSPEYSGVAFNCAIAPRITADFCEILRACLYLTRLLMQFSTFRIA